MFFFPFIFDKAIDALDALDAGKHGLEFLIWLLDRLILLIPVAANYQGGLLSGLDT